MHVGIMLLDLTSPRMDSMKKIKRASYDVNLGVAATRSKVARTVLAGDVLGGC